MGRDAVDGIMVVEETGAVVVWAMVWKVTRDLGHGSEF